MNLSQTETETSLYDQPKQRDGKKQTEADRRRKIDNMRKEGGEKRERARARDPGSLQSPVIIPRSQHIHSLLMIQAAAMSIFTV